jgi:uncharacterized membrane protein YuzA (DUF378 family)
MPSAKAKAKADAIEMVADIVGMVGTAVVTSIYAKKNAKFQQDIERDLQKLSDEQKLELRDSLAKIQDSNQRLATLMNYLSVNLGSDSASVLSSQIDTNLTGAVKKQTKIIFWVFGLSALAILSVYVIKKVRK